MHVEQIEPIYQLYPNLLSFPKSEKEENKRAKTSLEEKKINGNNTTRGGKKIRENNRMGEIIAFVLMLLNLAVTLVTVWDVPSRMATEDGLFQ